MTGYGKFAVAAGNLPIPKSWHGSRWIAQSARAEEFGLEAPLDDWRAWRQQIHDEVCENGFNAERNSFVQYYGGKTLDASLLMIALVGFLPAIDPRVQGYRQRDRA